MAAPHVTGIAGYLLSLDPTLTPAELRQLLVTTAHPVATGVGSIVDGFASAVAIDALRGNSNVMEMLLDIDDGTADGDLRVKCTPDCGEFTDEDADGDGGAGDGAIDMSDFRRWRDYLLITEDSPSLAMDGEDDNLKFDVNHNGIPEVGADENVYPDGDFNGDGVIDDTDLVPLQTLFSDSDYYASQLPGLIYSSDVHVDPAGCLPGSGARARVTIYDAGTMDWLDERDLNAPGDSVFTVPVAANGLLVRVTATDGDGNVAGAAQKKLASGLGSDAWFAPTCGKITLEPNQLNVVLNAGESTTEDAKLVSHGLAADWEITSSVAHVEPALAGGSLDADGEAALDPTITCPATPGGYGGFLDLEFRDSDGNVIDKAVPESLPVDIVCLPGGVEADPSPLTQTLSAGTSTQRDITLKNNGTELDYEAQAGDHVTIDDGASGELANLGQAVITVTLTCPLTPGSYSSTVALTFARADGKPVTVAHPESVPVDLECTGLLKLNGLVVENSVQFENLDKKWEQYWSRDDEATAEHNLRTTINNTTTYQHEVIDPIGWGDVSSSLAFSRTVSPPPPGFEWMAPFQRAGTMSGNGSVDYSASYDGTTATWGGDFAFDYSTTRPPPNPAIGQEVCGTFATQCSSLGATVTTYFQVLPNTQQHLLITWTCGIFESPSVPVGTNGAGGLIYINEIGPGGSTVFYSDSAQGCGYETVFGPGRYGLTATMYLVAGASTAAGPVSGSFTVTATYVPPDEP
jgi:hypothetical protein